MARDKQETYSDEEKRVYGNALTWAMRIRQRLAVKIPESGFVSEQECPDCGDKTQIVSFFEREKKDIIEKIVRHYGLWIERKQRGPPSRELEFIEGDYS